MNWKEHLARPYVGQKLTVRKDLKAQCYDDVEATWSMKDLRGETVTVAEVYYDEDYSGNMRIAIVEDLDGEWTWSPMMFEEYKGKKIRKPKSQE